MRNYTEFNIISVTNTPFVEGQSLKTNKYIQYCTITVHLKKNIHKSG